MSKIVRFIALIIIMTTLFTAAAFGNTQMTQLKFSDLEESYWAYDSIQKLVEAEIIIGYPDGTFKPEGYITRAELVKIVNLIFSYTETQDNSNLADIKSDDWFYNYVLIAQKAGYIIGFEDGTFRPNNNVTREQLCKIIVAINGIVELPFDKKATDEISPWATEYVNKVLSNRIMLLDENNHFRAVENATRAEVCDALAKFLITEENSDASSGGGSIGPTEKPNLNDTIDSVILELKKEVIPVLKSEEQTEIINDIISNMEKYLANDNHDYEKAAEAAYEKYKNLTEEEQEDLKFQIQYNVTTKKLIILKDFFFPNVNINI